MLQRTAHGDLSIFEKVLTKEIQDSKCISEIARDVILSGEKAPAGRYTTTQRICKPENPPIYREPMLTSGQLVTSGQFIQKSVNCPWRPLATLAW